MKNHTLLLLLCVSGLFGCNTTNQCNCDALQQIDGLYYLPDADAKTSLLVSRYMNSRQLYDSLVQVNPNNPLLAADSLDIYMAQHDSAGIVRQYAKMLYTHAQDGRTRTMAIQFHSPAVATGTKTNAWPVMEIYRRAQPYIRGKNQPENYLFMHALSTSITSEDFNAITQAGYEAGLPDQTYAGDSMILYRTLMNTGTFFQYYQQYEAAFAYYNKARSEGSWAVFKDKRHEVNLRSMLTGYLYSIRYENARSADEAVEKTWLFNQSPGFAAEHAYITALLLMQNGRMDEAVGQIARGHEKCGNDAYLKLLVNYAESLTGTQDAGNMVNGIAYATALAEARGKRNEDDRVNYALLKSLPARIKAYRQKLDAKNIDLEQITMELYTGRCTGEKTKAVQEFDGGQKVQQP